MAQDIMIPSVHLNGDTREELFRINTAALDAAKLLLVVLCNAAPNGRNFYVQGEDATKRAMAQHRARLTKVLEVAEELETISDALREDRTRPRG